MRSFAKTFRAVLALCLVLSIVMSFVTVSADAVDLAQVSAASAPNEDGLYEVKYNVSGVNAGNATILVHDAENNSSIASENVEYVGQKAPTSGTAEFTMLLEKGVYTVIGGGTGMTADSETLTLNAAPVFAVEGFAHTLVDNDEAGVAYPTATDADGDAVTYSLAGDAAANFAISGANIVINSESRLAAGKYEFTLVATSDGGTASIPVAITIESSDVEVEAFDAVAPKTVEWGTAINAIEFPAVTFGEVVFEATWACDTYNANVAGNYTFTATVAAKDGYDISAAAAPTVVVTVLAKNITVLDALKEVDVDWGTELEAVIALLPTTVTSGSDVFEVEAWEGAYEPAYGSYTFTAKLVAKDGYNVTAVATVVVNVAEEPVAAFDAVAPIAVAWGTAENAIEFPAVTYGGETFAATWACADYDANKAGEYTFTATVEDKDGYDIEDAAELTVVVTVEAKVVDKLDAIEAIDVAWGTELEDVIDLLPAEVTSGDDVFTVEAWASEDYEAVEGSYTFTATLVAKEGYNVTAVATVVVNVGEEPDEVVEAFDAVEPIAVAWGTAEDAIEFPAVTYGGETFEATWACAEYNANKAGEYTFKATVADKDGYDIKDAAELTVVVTVGQKVFAATEGEWTLSEDYYIEGTAYGDAVTAAGTAVVYITGGNYNGGQTPIGQFGNTAVWAKDDAKVYISGGNFTIGGLPEAIDDQIDMIYARDNAEIYISGGTFKGADETVWLVNVRDADYDAGTAKIVITGGTFINWDPSNGNGRGEKYIADGYYVKAENVGEDVYYTVVENEKITAFDAVEDFAVAWGTAADAIDFPAVTAGGVEFEANWVCANYNANVAGEYVFVAEIASKVGYTIEADEVSVVVTVEAKVVDKLDDIEAIDVDWGTELDAVIALLPAEVTSGDDVFTVEAWASEDYEAVEGSYTFTATLVAKEGYNVTAVATVVVNVGEEPDEVVEAFDAVAPIAVAWGTAAEAIEWPAVTYGGETFAATWACADYDANKAGEYTFTATVEDKDGYDIKNAAELTVVVTVEAKVVDKLDAIEAIDVDWGTELDAVIALLPAEVTSGDDVFTVEAWASEDYEAVEGSYSFTATLVAKEGYNVTAVATVVVNVGEEPDEVVEAFDAVEPIAVAWGTAAEAIEWPAVTYGGETFAATWACADYDANKAGEYTFTATVEAKDGYDIKNAAELTVVVTVGQKVFAATEGEYTLAEDYFVEGVVEADAVTAAGSAVVKITGGNYNGGQTPVGGAGNTAVWAKENAKVYISGGNFTIGGLPEGDAGQIDMIYARDSAEIYISGGTFKGADETVWLVNVRDADYDAGTAKIVITGGTFINWDPSNGNGRGEKYIAEGYTVKAATVGTETHYTVVEKTAVNTIDPITVFVMPGDLYEDVILTVPTELTSGEVIITDIVWPEVIGETWPPVGEEPLEVFADDFKYNENDVTLAEEAVPSINFVTIPDTFGLKVNGLEKDVVIAVEGEALNIETTYAGPAAAGEVKFFYSIKNFKTNTIEVERRELTSSEIEEFKTTVNGASKRITIYGTVGGKDLIAKSVNILVSNDLFNGNIYHNATEANPEYSALRVNRNRDYTVSFAFSGSNGDYDFSQGKFVVEVVGTNLVGEVAGTDAADGKGSYTFTSAQLSAKNGDEYVIPATAYKAKVTYFEGEDEVYSRERTVHIANRGFWYTEFSVNGSVAVGPRATRKDGILAKVVLDSTNAEGNAYVGFKVLPYGEELVNDGSGVTLTQGNVYEEQIDISGNGIGTHTLYVLANQEGSQNFYDLAHGKTMYIRDTYTNLCGVCFNGSIAMRQTVDGDLAITPNWGGRKPAAEYETTWTVKIMDRITLEDVILTADNIEGATVAADGTITVTVDPLNVDKGFVIKNADSVLPNKIYYEITAYVNGEVDKSVARRVLFINVD